LPALPAPTHLGSVIACGQQLALRLAVKVNAHRIDRPAQDLAGSERRQTLDFGRFRSGDQALVLAFDRTKNYNVKTPPIQILNPLI